jgi:uncharacterized RDD family membrane protein YckC
MQPSSAPADSTPYAYLWQRFAAFAIFYTAVAPIFIWLSVKKQRPLDMLAHTTVVRTEPARPRTL